MIIIENKYNIGETVYLKTDKEQLERIVTGVAMFNTGVLYKLAQSVTEYWHYEFEISIEKNILISSTS